MPISDFLYVSSYWVFYHALAENPNPIFQINPYTKKQLQLFGYYTMAFFMTRHCIDLIAEVEKSIRMSS